MSVLVAVQKDRRILTENRAHFFYLRRHFVFYLADKFFSKSGSMQEKPFDRVRASMAKFGPESLARFDNLCKEFKLSH